MGWLHSMLLDSDETNISSKRVITLVAFILVSVSFIADQFTLHSADKNLFDSMIYLVIAGLGFTASEKFAPKGKRNDKID